MQGAVLREPLHVAGVALVKDILERDPALLHIGDRDGPVVERGTEGHRALRGIQFPARVVHLLVHALDQLVDLIDHSCEADLHLLLVHLQLVDQPVHLVDEENRADTFLESLAEHCLRLGHSPLDGINHDNSPIHCAHGTGHVAPEVNVTGRIDHIDQVLPAAIRVDHRDVARIDGDAACLLFLIGIHEELPSSELLADHACPCEQVI